MYLIALGPNRDISIISLFPLFQRLPVRVRRWHRQQHQQRWQREQQWRRPPAPLADQRGGQGGLLRGGLRRVRQWNGRGMGIWNSPLDWPKWHIFQSIKLGPYVLNWRQSSHFASQAPNLKLIPCLSFLLPPGVSSWPQPIASRVDEGGHAKSSFHKCW